MPESDLITITLNLSPDGVGYKFEYWIEPKCFNKGCNGVLKHQAYIEIYPGRWCDKYRCDVCGEYWSLEGDES